MPPSNHISGADTPLVLTSVRAHRLSIKKLSDTLKKTAIPLQHIPPYVYIFFPVLYIFVMSITLLGTYIFLNTGTPAAFQVQYLV